MRGASHDGVARGPDSGVRHPEGSGGGPARGLPDPATAEEEARTISDRAGMGRAMAGEDIRKDLRELREQIEAPREAFPRVPRPSSELGGYLERLQDLSRGYLRIMDLVQRYGGVSPDLAVPGVKDDISRHIVAALMDRGERNISQITDAVKGRRGTASRRIVRERLPPGGGGGGGGGGPRRPRPRGGEG